MLGENQSSDCKIFTISRFNALNYKKLPVIFSTTNNDNNWGLLEYSTYAANHYKHFYTMFTFFFSFKYIFLGCIITKNQYSLEIFYVVCMEPKNLWATEEKEKCIENIFTFEMIIKFYLFIFFFKFMKQRSEQG